MAIVEVSGNWNQPVLDEITLREIRGGNTEPPLPGAFRINARGFSARVSSVDEVAQAYKSFVEHWFRHSELPLPGMIRVKLDSMPDGDTVLEIESRLLEVGAPWGIGNTGTYQPLRYGIRVVDEGRIVADVTTAVGTILTIPNGEERSNLTINGTIYR